jgi:putative transposase
LLRSYNISNSFHDEEAAVAKTWNELPAKYRGVEIDEFIVMPNHIHGIIVLNVGAGPCACPDPDNGQPPGVSPTRLALPDVVHRFKSFNRKA